MEINSISAESSDSLPSNNGAPRDDLSEIAWPGAFLAVWQQTEY
jgi:hypothetical protein